MTAATALFMLPAALVFPSLLRQANTPPPSNTLAWRRRRHREIINGRHLREKTWDADYAMGKYEEAVGGVHKGFLAAPKAGEKLIADRPFVTLDMILACD